jgi:hypothetical protein
MKPFVSKTPNPTLTESVSDLVAEGGNVLASDDAPVAAARAPVDTHAPVGSPAQIWPGRGPLPLLRRILRRSSNGSS